MRTQTCAAQGHAGKEGFKVDFVLPLRRDAVGHAETLLGKLEDPRSAQAREASACLSARVPASQVKLLIAREISSRPGTVPELLSAMGARQAVGPKNIRRLREAIETSRRYHSLNLTSGSVTLSKTMEFSWGESDVPHEVVVLATAPTPAEAKVLAPMKDMLVTYPGSATLFGHVFGDAMLIREYQHNVDQDIQRTSAKEDYAAAMASRGSWKEHLLISAVTLARERGLKRVQIPPAEAQLRTAEPNADEGRFRAAYDEFPKRMGFVLHGFELPENAPVFFRSLAEAASLTQVWEADVEVACARYGLDRLLRR